VISFVLTRYESGWEGSLPPAQLGTEDRFATHYVNRGIDT